MIREKSEIEELIELVLEEKEKKESEKNGRMD